jgi:probable rRNA maturation factor
LYFSYKEESEIKRQVRPKGACVPTSTRKSLWCGDLFFKEGFDKIRVTHHSMTNEVTVHAIEAKFEALKNPVRKQILEILMVLKKEGVAIDVLLIGNRKMRALNKKYRGKDSSTNVLSFEEPKQFIYPQKGSQRKGEIYLNPEMANDWWMGKNKKKAEEFLTIQFLLVHGVLHLFGYDHIEDGDAIKMEKKESQLMRLLEK